MNSDDGKLCNCIRRPENGIQFGTTSQDGSRV